MKQLFSRWKKIFAQKRFLLFCFLGFLSLAAALYFTGVTSRFADSQPVVSLRDLILDRLPAVNLDFLNTFGFLFVIFAFMAAILIYQPEEIPFVLFSAALFVFVRAAFVAMTHLGAPADILKLSWQTGFLKNLSFTIDLFFSGHTGLPFLAFLVLRPSLIKKFFLFASLVMGASVLLSHVHYCIDVFAAFFITYAVFKIA